MQSICRFFSFKLLFITLFFFFFKAREIEIQTHCTVNMEVLLTWNKGKPWRYSSSNIVPTTPNAPSISTTSTLLDHQSILDSSQKRHATVENESASQAKKRKANACKVCGKEEETSFWLGCGFTPKKKAKKETCNYWVHQGCIGLRCKKRSPSQRCLIFVRNIFKYKVIFIIIQTELTFFRKQI